MYLLNFFSTFLTFLIYRTSTKECLVDDHISQYVKSGRLPKHIKPIEYHLSFVFDKELTSYSAFASIKLIIEKETDVIILHSDKFTIETVEGYQHVEDIQDEHFKMKISDICSIQEKQFLVLRLKNVLVEKKFAYIEFRFKGEISSGETGLSSYSYYTKDKILKKIISTKFQDTMARTVFPCFDEPQLKAVFHLQITHHLPYESISSMVVDKRDIIDDTLVQKFAATKLISSFSLSFAILDYQHISGLTKSGIYVTLYLPKDMILRGKFALDMSLKIIDTYEDLLGVKFPSDKLDIVGIQGFGVGSGWGIITLGYDNILVDERKTCYMMQTLRSTKIAYEIAFQWFTHLTTPVWWNEIWLSDGISEYISYHAMQIIRPEERMFDFLKYQKSKVLTLDEMKTTHSISYKSKPIHKTIFNHDGITQIKSAEILGILHSHVGHHKFFKCLEKYIFEFKYSTADTLKFWSVVEVAAGFGKVYQLMTQFTHSIGFPLISIEKDSANSYSVSQERMLLTDDIREIEKASHQFWELPIFYITDIKSKHIKSKWLSKKTDTIKLKWGDKLVQINPGSVYFYRSRYGKEILKEMAEALIKDVNSFSSADKIALISDAFAMLEMGFYDVKTTFDLFEFMKSETDVYVLCTFTDCLADVAFYICDPSKPPLKYFSYIKEFLKSVLDHLGWKYIPDKLLQEAQIEMIGYNIILQDMPTIEKASSIFERYLIGEEIDQLEFLAVYGCGYLAKHHKDGAQKLFDLYKSTFDPTEAEIYSRTFMCLFDTDSTSKILYLTLTDEIPKHEKLKIIGYLSYFYPRSKIVQEFVMTEYEKIIESFGGHGQIRGLFYDIFKRMKTEKELEIFKSFLAKHNIPESDTDIQLIIETTKKAIRWRINNLEDFHKYFPE